MSLIGIDVIDSIIKNPAMRYNFRVALPADFGDANLISLRVNEVEFEGMSLESEPLPEWPNYTKSVPSTVNNNPLTLRFMEGEDGETLKYLQNWFDAIVRKDVQNDRYGDLNFEAKYKRTILIYLLTRTGDTWKTFEVQDAYPKSFFKLSLGFDSTNMIIHEANFDWDGLKIY